MLTWHLCSARGASLRTCVAESLTAATNLLQPVPYDCFIASDASYRIGWKQATSPANVCVKCFRLPCSPGVKKCEGCRKRDHASTNGVAERKRETRDARWRANLSPEARQAMHEREKERKREEYRKAKKGAVRTYTPRATQPKGS